MQTFLTISPRERGQHLNLAAMRSGVPGQLLEHDWWQSFVLKNIFSLPIAPFLTLHGSRCLRPH